MHKLFPRSNSNILLASAPPYHRLENISPNLSSKWCATLVPHILHTLYTSSASAAPMFNESAKGITTKCAVIIITTRSNSGGGSSCSSEAKQWSKAEHHPGCHHKLNDVTSYHLRSHCHRHCYICTAASATSLKTLTNVVPIFIFSEFAQYVVLLLLLLHAVRPCAALSLCKKKIIKK